MHVAKKGSKIKDNSSFPPRKCVFFINIKVSSPLQGVCGQLRTKSFCVPDSPGLC